MFTIFSFTDASTSAISTLSLHDALPISVPGHQELREPPVIAGLGVAPGGDQQPAVGIQHLEARAGISHGEAGVGPVSGSDRKSTRLNSSHGYISYAVFCLKKKKKL